VIAQQIGAERHFETNTLPGKRRIRISVDVHDGVLHAIVPRHRITVSSPDIFIVWMLGSSLILLAVAILFLRNQIRPVLALADAAHVQQRLAHPLAHQALWRSSSRRLSGKTSSPRRVAPRCRHAQECGGFDLTDVWSVDAPIAADMVTVFAALPRCRHYPDTLGYAEQFQALVRAWRPALRDDR